MRSSLPNGENIKWPGGAKVAVALTFDFDADRLQYARLKENTGFAESSRGMYGPDTGLERCLNILRDRNVPATFFIPGINIERFPDHCARIASQGFEIACHGYAHDKIFEEIPEKEELESLERSEELIKKLCGRNPAGYRPPNGMLQSSSIDLIAQRGYKYSASANARKSCDWAYCYEKDGTRIPLVEISNDIVTDDFTFFFYSLNFPYHRSMYGPDTVREIWQDEFDGRIPEENKVMVLKLHPSLIGRSSRAVMLNEFIAYMKQNGAWFASCEQIADLVLENNGFRKGGTK